MNVRWGIVGNRGITMPSHGRADRREFTPNEQTALGEDGAARLGPATLDIYLNDRAFWRNVPEKVWGYSLGGYQVLKKWLSYREAAVLGRDLTAEEVGYFEKVCRRFAALFLLGPRLDENYRRASGSAYRWPAAAASSRSGTVPLPENEDS
jgi:hypothetical protein